jgi:hypothetical protein
LAIAKTQAKPDTVPFPGNRRPICGRGLKI